MKSGFSKKVSVWVIVLALFLTAGGVYYAQAQQFLDSNIVTVKTPSGTVTPYVLNCVPVGDSKISVSWYGSISASHTIQLYGASSPIAPPISTGSLFGPTSGPGSSPFTENSLSPSTQRWYVLVTNGTVWSNVVHCQTSGPQIPGRGSASGDTPTNLSIFAQDAGTLILNWKDNVTSTRPYQFEIQRINTTPFASTNFEITGKQADSVSFRWKNATGYSPFNAVLERSTSTDPIFRFSKNDISSTSIAIYPSFDPLGVANPSYFNYSDSNVDEATTYFYRMRACSIIPVGGLYMTDNGGSLILNKNKPQLACSDSIPTGISNAAISTTTLPFAPSNLIATTFSPSSIGLTWRDNSRKEAGFYVYRNGQQLLPAVGPSSPINGTVTYADTGLGSGTTYSYSVKSFVNVNGTDVLSDDSTNASSSSNIATTQVTLSVAKTPSSGGSVSGSGINCGSNCSSIFNVGDEITLTASPANSSLNFTKWSGNVCNNSTSTVCTFIINADSSVTANFTQIQTQIFTLTVSSTPSVGGSISANVGINCGGGGTICSKDINANVVVQLTATHATGYTFSNWSGNVCNSPNSSSNDYFASPNCSFVINSNTSVTANFTKNSVTGPTSHLYADLYDSARGWITKQGEQLKFLSNNLWGSLVSFVETGRQFITENFFGVDVSLGQNQSVNYDGYFVLNKFFVNSNTPFRIDTGLSSNSVYLYRVRVVYQDGGIPSTSPWSDMMAGKTFDGSASSNGLSSPVCTGNSFCDRTFMTYKSNIINGYVEQSEAQCQINADCKNVGRSSRTIEEK